MPEDLQKIRINLSGKPKDSLSGLFFKWAVNTGRIIIVTTELLALGALLYRFTIDRKIVDLHDQIKIVTASVKSQEKKENDYRSIQERLKNIKETNDATEIKIDIMNQILKTVTSGDFSSTNLILNENIINLTGSTFSIFPINNFIDELKQNPEVASISIDEINSGEKGISFKINIEIKKSKT